MEAKLLETIYFLSEEVLQEDDFLEEHSLCEVFLFFLSKCEEEELLVLRDLFNQLKNKKG